MSWRSLGRLFSGIKGAYNDINPSTLTGAIDVLVVEQPDGSFTSGPFHVRFGKLTAISPADKTVEVYVNGKYVNFIRMQLGSAGDAYFVEPDESDVSGEECLRPTEEELLRTHWPSIASRRRRRRLRRDTAQSESDMNQPEYEELFDEGPQSDCEQSTLSSPDHDPRVAHFISDSMLHDTFASREDLEWVWGNFPQRKSEGYLGAKSAVVDTDEPSPLTRKSCTTLQSSSVAAVPKSEGVYLEDLVTPEVDQTVKEAYIYPPARTLSRSPRSRLHQDSGGCVDAGYRSDGEHSPRSISPIYPSVFGLRLSLCGWPSLGSQLSEEKFFEHLVSYEEFIQDPEAILSNPNLTIQLNGKFLNWQVAAPSILSILAFQSELPHCVVRRLENLHMRKKEIRRTSWFSWGSRSAETADHAHSENTASAVQPLPQVVEIEPPEQSELEKMPSITVPDIETTAADSGKPSGRRSNRLSSEEIARLQLKPGRNEVEFRVTTKIQGTCICSASIFVWHWTDRIVVSDVDGTITRSDLLGHLLPMLGRDWTHFGVAGLYNLISRNGYRFIYVSTRALGQADITRSYLRHVNQNDLSLPEGPILLSPNSLLHAFHQEVIEKKPENFKIQCLLDVCSLFPSDHPPFYAGFGNKTNDAFAYEKAGIDRCHIFIVNPRGEVRNEFHPAKITSYTELSQMVDHYFPSIVKPIKQTLPVSTTDTVQASTTSETQNLRADSAKSFDDSNIDMSKYSCFTYWRTTEFEPCSTYESSAEP
ncbi:Nuclear elongation and deformation protein 1 [Clonorchis sinensis]|uniref:phosphatidate phosphatase n=1 Tax=Clonorchis sinensis TaxID=79923 RepID=A0A8T1MH94_CLOSI|nr:Nuclear elongation and deformation protein 1 [Clonorchis sinensis]